MEKGHNTPRVSVIVTTYNRKELLCQTIDSILKQTFRDFELIVVDNNSDYDFYRVIEEFGDDRIRPFQNANNGIIAVNRNYGISRAKGKYLAFCDDDDLWDPKKLETQVEYAERTPKCIISTSYKLIDENNTVFKVGARNPYRNKYDLYRSNRISFSSVLVENASLIRFNEDPVYFAIEDWCLWLKLIHEGYSIYIIQEPLLLYRYALQNVSRKKLLRPIKQIACLSSVVINYPGFKKGKYVSAVLYNILIFIAYQILRKK